jgi:superfamily II DNA/RNA helicase
MLDMGFADAIKKIIETITKHKDNEQHFQRVLLSATPTTGLFNKKNANKIRIFSVALSDFVKISLNKNPLRVDISEEFNEESVITVPKTLKQMFTIVPSK